MVNLLLITATAGFTVGSIYDVVETQLNKAAIVAPEKKLQKRRRGAYTPEKSLSHYDAIKERNLFNTKSAIGADDTKTEDVDVTSLKKTSLKMKLWGTILGPPGMSYAIIEETTKRVQDLYRKGDTIQNATIKHILREKVVLSVGGRDEILEMEKLLGGKGLPVRTGRAGRAPGSMNINVDRAEIDESLENINELMKQIRVRPHFSGGRPDGLILSSIKSNSIFRKMGLRNGDILQGIDGKPIESVDDALGLADSLMSASNIRLEIKRRGKPQIIEYNIK